MATRIVSAASLRESFIEQAPADYLERLTQGMIEVYAQSARLASGLEFPESQTIAPLLRRVFAEQGIRNFSQSFAADGVDALAVATSRRSSYYTLFGWGSFVLTQSVSRGPGRLPPKARFRSMLALNNAGFEDVVSIRDQLHLFEGNETLGPEDRIFAILHHGSVQGRPGELRFLRIGFPDAGYGRFVGETIDLLNLKRPVSMEAPEEEIIDRALPLVRVRRKTLD